MVTKESDKLRVLRNIAIDTSGTVHDKMERLSIGWSMRFRFRDPVPQFLPVELAQAINMPLKKGDIVRCVTNPNHPWGISEYIKRLDGYGEFLLREIGSDRLLRMGNEMLDVLRFMDPSRLYTGKKHQLYVWASQKAFMERYNPNADYFKRCGGVEIVEDPNELRIWSRPHVWMQGADKNGMFSQPRKMEIRWNKKTRLRDIVVAMNEQGFGDEFEKKPTEPTNGTGGCAKFTKEDIETLVREHI